MGIEKSCLFSEDGEGQFVLPATAAPPHQHLAAATVCSPNSGGMLVGFLLVHWKRNEPHIQTQLMPIPFHCSSFAHHTLCLDGHTYTRTHARVEARGSCWVSSSMALYLIFLRSGFSLNLELNNMARP